MDRMMHDAENRQMSRSNSLYMVISRPSSERMYALSCPRRTSSRPVQSASPLCRTVPFFTERPAVPSVSRRCWEMVRFFQMGK